VHTPPADNQFIERLPSICLPNHLGIYMQKTVRTLILSAALLYSGFACAQEFQTQTISEPPHQLDVQNLDPSALPPGPAPPLTQFYNEVCSTLLNGCEFVSNGGTTPSKHGGTYILVYIWEIGYGVGEIASQGGNALTSAYLISKLPICISGTSYVTTCGNGQTVVGYQYGWNVTHYVEGNYGNLFAAQDTSINSPFNTIRTSFTIQH
jgi:hypothetical protein